MKKMNKMYEAPKAEVIEMQMTMVLMGSPGSQHPTGTGTGYELGGDSPE